MIRHDPFSPQAQVQARIPVGVPDWVLVHGLPVEGQLQGRGLAALDRGEGDMTPDKLRALRAIRDGGEVARHEINWMLHWEYIDKDKKLTVKGAEALSDYEEENTGD